MCVRTKLLIWEPQALKDAQKAATWYKQNLGQGAADKFYEEIYHIVNQLLPQHPFIGKIDPIFEDGIFTYRSIVTKHHKIVYYILDTQIRIFAIWDCRQQNSTIENQEEQQEEQQEIDDNK